MLWKIAQGLHFKIDILMLPHFLTLYSDNIKMTIHRYGYMEMNMIPSPAPSLLDHLLCEVLCKNPKPAASLLAI